MKNYIFDKKRMLQILFVILLIAGICMVVSACQCQHEYESQITVPATCSTIGEVTYTCSKCGDKYTEQLSATNNHTIGGEYVSDDEGHWHKCADCDYISAKTPHEFTTVVKSEQSTCTKQGTIVTSCVCGKTHTEILQLADHNYSVYQGSADKHWLKCENCDSTTNEEPHSFTLQGDIVPSTCVKQGSSVTRCVCGESHVEYLPLLEHNYSKIIYDADSHWVVCSVCDKEDESQQRIPHTLSEQSRPALCEQTGEVVVTCNGCDYAQKDILPALGHDLDETAFSLPSASNGHYYKCNRCAEDIRVAHKLIDCDCPDGLNRDATCYKSGHQDQQCSVCGWQNHFSTPITNEHNFSLEWSYNGASHWRACLNGDGQCSARSNESMHVWSDIRTDPTCTENGSIHRECECGAIQSGSFKTLEKLGHDYVVVDVIRDATCEETGLVVKRCTRCQEEAEEETKKLDHVMQGYVSTLEGHYRKCINCGFTQTTIRNHTWTDNIVKEATCQENGLTIRICSVCNYTYELVTTKSHNYITDPDSYIDATCETFGTHKGTCSYCGDTKIFVDEHLGFADHNVKEYPAKEMTETLAGNIRYWQCSVCNRYFTSHSCEVELTEDQVFIYPPKVNETSSVSQLIALGKTLPNNECSNDYYLLTAAVEIVDADNRALMIMDDSESIYITLIQRENAATINERDEITVKGKLFRDADDVVLVDCEVVSVKSQTDGLYSLYISVTEEYSSYFYAFSGMGDVFTANTNNYNCLMEGDSLTFNVYCYENTVLQKVIINGKPYTMVAGKITLNVTEDIHAEFVLGRTNKCSVRLYDLDTTNNNGNAIIADEYISYTYTNGGYNEDGRLHKNSHLTFTADNANIIGINITYDADWLADNPNILNNTVNAIRADGGKVAVSQGTANNKSQVTISLDGSYTALEYFANASQARIFEIIVLYETYNT